MTILSRLLFFISLFAFASAAVFWESLTGVILWRVGLALGVMSISTHLLWGVGSKALIGSEVIRDDAKAPMCAFFLILSTLQFGLLLFAFVPFYFPLGSGIQFIYTVSVIAPCFLLTSLIWLVLGRYYDVQLLDQLIPYMALVIFFLASSLSPAAVIYAKIFSVMLGLLSMFMIYQNWIRMMRQKG